MGGGCHPFTCPSYSKSLFITHTHSGGRGRLIASGLRETARGGNPWRNLSDWLKHKTKGAWAAGGTQWKAGSFNESGRAGKAMNYAAACKSSFAKVFWKRSHFRTVRVSVSCFSESPCLFDTLSSFFKKQKNKQKKTTTHLTFQPTFQHFLFKYKITNSDFQPTLSCGCRALCFTKRNDIMCLCA